MPIPEGLDLGDDDYVQPTAVPDELDSEQLDGVEGGDDEVETQEPEKQYVDLDELADRYVRVGDEDVLVKDLPAGWMKNKDYTQKTQRIAEQAQAVAWAEALQAALAEDFDGTIDVLRPVWGGNSQPAEVAPISDDPLAREIADLRSWQRAQMAQSAQTQAEQVRQQIAGEVQFLTQEYGEDFDFEATRQLAFDRKMTLTDAALILDGQRAREQRKKDAANQARVKAKRDDAVMATGGSRRAVEPGSQQYTNLEDALNAAVREVSSRRG